MHALEVLLEIVEVHPKQTVIFLHQAEFFFQFIRPEGRLIGPVALPLEATPGIAQLQKIVIPKLLDSDQAVRVMVGQADFVFFFGFLALNLDIGTHNVAFLVELQKICS